MTSSLTLASVATFYYAHRLLRFHESQHKKDVKEDDPLKYTTIKTFCFLPAVIGVGSLLAKSMGKEQALRNYWRKLVAIKSFYWFLQQAYLANFAFYFGAGFACLFVDLTKWPGFVYDLKLNKNANIDYKIMLPKLFKTLLLNLCLPWMTMALPQKFKEDVALKLAGPWIRVTPDMPSLWELTKHYWTFLVVYDTLFFYSHWLLHQPGIYDKIHKKHHEWKYPTSLAAAYAHPVEHAISNILPAVVSMAIVRPHYLTFVLYVAVGLGITLAEHSGYEIVDTSAFHAIHHAQFKNNYGVSGLLDEFHGTRVYGSRDLFEKKTTAKIGERDKTVVS